MSQEAERVLTSDHINIIDHLDLYHARVSELLAKPQRAIGTMQQFKSDGPILQRFTGTPRGTKEVKAGDLCYRQYCRGKESYESILSTRELRSGKVPYAITARNSRAYWDDLTGIFVTDKDSKPGRIGVPESKYFVDFTLPCDLSLLKIEDGILLIPDLEGSKVAIPINIADNGRNE